MRALYIESFNILYHAAGLYLRLMNKKVFLIYSACLCSTSTNAQHGHIIMDALRNTPVAFATISSKNTYATASENGYFNTSLFGKTDTLNIHCIGYSGETLYIDDLPDTVFLQPSKLTLPEVVVNATGNRQITVDNYTGRRPVRAWGDVAGIERATRLDFPEVDKGRVKKINAVGIKMKKKTNSNLCRLHLYAAKADGSPGEELLNRNVFITKEDIKGRTCTKDLSAENIYTCASGIFIGIEYVGQVFTNSAGTIIADTTNEYNRSVVFETLHYTDAATYTRTSTYRNWVLLDGSPFDDGHPVNMMVSVKYE